MKTRIEAALIAAVLLAGALLLAGIADAHAGERMKPAGRIDAPALYHNYCSVCHGDNGDGNSRARNSLIPAPANFTDPKLQGKLTREYIAAVTREGKPKTAMVGWKTQLSDAEIAALAEYVHATFVANAHDQALKRGRTLYGHYCVSCHGIGGAGVAANGNPAPRDLTSESARRSLTREGLVAVVAVGRKGTAMKGFAGPLGAEDLEAVVDYVQRSLMGAQAGNISGVSAHGGRERDTKR